MTTPDATVAFESDAKNSESVEDLKARIRELEGDGARESMGPSKPTEEPGPELYNADGTPYRPDEAKVPEVSDVKEVDVAGTVFRFHPPKTAALVAFGMGASDKRDAQTQLSTLRRFLKFALTEDSWEEMLDRMMDPADEFSDSDMADVVSGIADKVKESPEAKAPKNGPRGRK